MKIREIGAGNGKFALLLSNHVGENGHVYANEFDEQKLIAILELAQLEMVNNLTPIR